MAEIKLHNKNMNFVYDSARGGIISLTSALDQHQTEYVLTPQEFQEYDIDNSKWLGSIEGSIRIGQSDYRFATGSVKEYCECKSDHNEIRLDFCEIKDENRSLGFSIRETLRMKEDILEWTIQLNNHSNEEITFCDLNLPLLMNQYFRKDNNFKYERCVMRHTCVVGHSSYLYWEKSSGNRPVLLMIPMEGTAFLALASEREDKLFGARFGDGYGYEGMVRVHLISEKPSIDCSGNVFGLKPGETRQLRLGLTFLKSTAQISDTMTRYNLVTLKAVPGIVGPICNDFQVLTKPVGAKVSVRSAEDQIIDTEIKNGWRISKIRFGAYGRRYVDVEYQGNTASYCFFITEPVRDMLDQHAAFIAENHLETDIEDPCYHALLMWDMTNKRRVNSTFNPYYEDWWGGGSDDPGLASGLFLAEKNVYRPREEEIAVLNSFVEDFIIRRLTEQPGWRVHRMVPWYTMFEPWAGRGADDVWRAFNYVHVINIMRNMYLIQKLNNYGCLRMPEQYLLMAYEYTKAMFNYWMFPDGVGASEYGNMGEMTLPLFLAKDLENEGYIQEAAEMNAIFDKKAHFLASEEFPFGSEMVYDSTAFEAVYAYGKRIKNSHIMESAAMASYANRGKQPVWFLYNTDVRGGGDTEWNSSYMTQLGAYPLLDYTLDEGHIDEDRILAYYGAYLSGWLIYNSGGYWNSDKENKGATGWITVGSRINQTTAKRWTESHRKKQGMPIVKGCVALSGEAGIGYFGALRTTCSIVMDHSVLGRIGLGCEIMTDQGTEVILPHDGLSMRVYHVPEQWKLEVSGGRINKIENADERVILDVTVWACSGMELCIYSIPEEGGQQKKLYQEVLNATQEENQILCLEKLYFKSREETIGSE